jgi:hypothetical protein
MPTIGDERKRLFARVAERHPQLADIERKTERSIPGGPHAQNKLLRVSGARPQCLDLFGPRLT